MIAMANPFADYLTVRQTMEAIEALAPSTVTRLVYDEDRPKPDGRRLAGKLIEGHGWMIQKKSVTKYLEEQSAKSPGVGYPRGRSRKADKAKTAPKAKRARKATRS
jgi:hypothetical protein